MVSFFATAQEWHHPFGWRDSKEFGIVNDSSADVTAGMRLMMASFNAQGGVAVFPIGRFLVSDSVLVPSSVSIRGSGGTTYAPSKGSQGTAFYFNSATKNFLVTKPTVSTDFTIGNVFENFSITNVSAGASAGSAIYQYHTSASITRNVEIENFWDNITIRAGNGYFIKDCGLYGFVHTGITIGNNINPDEGDYNLSGLIVASSPVAVQPYAGILWIGSGGFKLAHSKFIGSGTKVQEMKYCVSFLGTDGATSDIDIDQVSMENYDSTGIYANFQNIFRHFIMGNIQIDGNGSFGPAINIGWAGAYNSTNGLVSINNFVISDFSGTVSQPAILINNGNIINIGKGVIFRYSIPSVTNSTNVNVDYSMSNVIPTSTSTGYSQIFNGTAQVLYSQTGTNTVVSASNFYVNSSNALVYKNNGFAAYIAYDNSGNTIFGNVATGLANAALGSIANSEIFNNGNFTIGSVTDNANGKLQVTGDVALEAAGNALRIAEGANGRVGQTTLVSGTKVITISGLTTSSRAFVSLVSQGGTSTTVYEYVGVCTANTLTITAITTAGATVATDTGVINYFVINSMNDWIALAIVLGLIRPLFRRRSFHQSIYKQAA